MEQKDKFSKNGQYLLYLSFLEGDNLFFCSKNWGNYEFKII